jgi:hypothetical protein
MRIDVPAISESSLRPHSQLTGWVKNAFDKQFAVYAEEDARSVRTGLSDKRTAGASLRYRL